LRLAICGAGVAGSYLYSLLSLNRSDIKLEIFDGNPRRGCSCAFGTFYSLLAEKLKRVHLNVEDYVLSKNTGVVINGVFVKLRNEITIDKPRLVRDLCPHPIPMDVDPFSVEGDIVVNATGKPLGPHHTIPTHQFKAKVSGLEPRTNYVLIDPKYAGYAWAFPLDEEGRWFHIGAGCVNASPEVLVDRLMKRYKIEVASKACSCSRPIAIVDPRANLTKGRVVSIGEAGGFVYPITGEGILPSMDSAEMLFEALGSPSWLEAYISRARKYFEEWEYDKAFKLWRLLEKHPTISWLLGAPVMLKRSRRRAMPKVGLPTVVKLFLRLFL
jgi:flavin-dependent dehydrogenase